MTRAFVLGAGSSRGALQAGAIERLYEAGIKPDMVLGSSIGAINAVFLAQSPDLDSVKQLQALYRQTDFQDVFDGNPLTAVTRLINGAESLFKNGSFQELIETHLHVSYFRDLKLRCYVVATDLASGAATVFGDDADESLADALLSSAAMLPLHPPHHLNGRSYGDGALKATLPLMQAIDRGATEIVALNLTTQLRPLDDLNSPVDMLMHSIDILLQTQVALTIENARQATDIPIRVLNLEPETYTSFTDLDGMDQLIEQGRLQAEAALEDGKLAVP